jgi:hypothetical protein
MSFSKKRAVIEAVHPLQDENTLRHILGFVGAGHWLYLGAVNKLFKLLAGKLDSIEVRAVLSRCSVDCDSRTTLASAVFASPARLQLALGNGLWFSDSLRGVNYKLNRSAGLYADILTLELAKQLGLVLSHGFEKGVALSGSTSKMIWLHKNAYESRDTRIITDCAVQSGSIALVKWLQRHQGASFTEYTMEIAAQYGYTYMCEYLLTQQCPFGYSACKAAAAAGRTGTLRWLREHHFPWNEESMRKVAALGGCVGILQHLLEQGAPWNAVTLTTMLSAAASRGKLEAVQWLRQQGAEWPAILQYNYTFLDLVFCRDSWHPDVVAWARQQGCTSPELQH